MGIQELFEALKTLSPSETIKPVHTMPYIFGKERKENFMSDWLAFVLNPQLNGIGTEPIKIFLDKFAEKARKKNIPIPFDRIDVDDLYFDIGDDAEYSKCREVSLGDDGRIDFLIDVYKSEADVDEDKNNVLFRIAIENKIYSYEGYEQTGRYYNAIKSICPECDNVYILLTLEETEPQCGNFINITYNDFIPELKRIPLNFVDDLRKAFLVNEFIVHMEKIMDSKKETLMFDNDDKLVIANIEQLKEVMDRYENVLYKFYSSLETMEFLADDGWNCYQQKKNKTFLQFYKTEWEDYRIHYEIFSKNNGKYYLSANGAFAIALHVEYKGSEKTRILDILRNAKRPEIPEKDCHCRVVEKSKLNEDSAFCISFDNQNFAEDMDKIIENIKKVFGILHNNYTEEIDKIIRDISK